MPSSLSCSQRRFGSGSSVAGGTIGAGEKSPVSRSRQGDSTSPRHRNVTELTQQVTVLKVPTPHPFVIVPTADPYTYSAQYTVLYNIIIMLMCETKLLHISQYHVLLIK